MHILELPDNKPILSSGYSCVMHYHTTIEECKLDIIGEIDKKTKQEKQVKFLKNYSRARMVVTTNNLICGEKFENFPNLGRFALRDEGKTIAIGKILKISTKK